MQADCRLNIGEIVFKALRDDFVEPASALCVPAPRIAAHSVQGECPHSRGQRFAWCGYHPAFAGSQTLCRIKAKNNHIAAASACANWISCVMSPRRVGGVLDHEQAMPP